MILKHRPSPKAPTEGDYKITHHFALWPIWINNKMVWLERYKRVWEWETRTEMQCVGRFHFRVDTSGWELRQTKRVTN